MSWEKFQDECPDCQPVLIDQKTQQPLPDDSPQMQAVLRVWRTTSRSEREAYHRVMCQNSRRVFDLSVVQAMIKRIEAAMAQKLH